MNQTMSQYTICTIVAKNYIASARTLCESFLVCHPDSKCYVLVVDEIEGFIDPAHEDFEFVSLEELGISDLSNLCFKYNVVELSTAVKPFLLEYLIQEKSIDKLLYLDPDILITKELNNLYDHLDHFDIVLTPHLDTDYPEDNLLPDDALILTRGVFNLGFIGINASQNARFFLHWWQGKLKNKCILDLAKGYFVDQKFIDLVPALFDNIFIEKEVGYNVSWWNMHSRHINKGEGSWKCNDKPLYFFHFSNYNPQKPDSLKLHTTRFNLLENPDFQQLASLYAEQLLKNDFRRSRGWPYSLAKFTTGEQIPLQLRIWYLRSPHKWKRYGNPFESVQLKRRARWIKNVNRAKKISHLGKVRNFLLNR